MKKIFNSTFLAITLFPKPACGDWSCADFKDVENMIRHIITNILLPIASGVAVIMLIWGAFQYLTAYGNEEKAQKGKTIIVWSLIGLVVIALAWLMITWLWEITTGGPPPVSPP